MADLYAFVYVSTAVRVLSLDDIDQLLEKAQLRNAEAGVTGVLLYDSGNFMQYLEGPASGLTNAYANIKAARLHHGIVELLREPIAAREFGEWAMAFRSVNAFGLSRHTLHDDLLAQKLVPSDPPASAARLLLTKFWGRGQQRNAF